MPTLEQQVSDAVQEYADNQADFNLLETAREIIDKVSDAVKIGIQRDVVGQLKTTLNDYLEGE